MVAGKAWEASDEGAVIGFINVAVGLRTNEWVNVIQRQNEEHQALETKVESMHAELEQIKDAIGFKAEATNTTTSFQTIRIGLTTRR